MRNATSVLPFKTHRPTRRHYFLRVNFRPFSFFMRTTRAKIIPAHGRNPRGGQGGTIPPKILGGGDDIAHIPPNKLSAQLRKITICLDNRMKCNFYRLLQRNEKEVIAF